MQVSTVYIICHYWPNEANYTVMPSFFVNEEDARECVRFCTRTDNGVACDDVTQFCGDKHMYAIMTLQR